MAEDQLLESLTHKQELEVELPEVVEWRQLRYVKQAVLLHHGIDMSADSWFYQEDPTDTGFPVPIQLWKAGYDVWLVNNRGVSHS